VFHDLPEFTPRIEVRDVFAQLIADEVRSGRLSPARRRRIVRYGARLGLSAVEVGRMVTACRNNALASPDPVERRHALRLVEPPPERAAAPLKIAMIVLAALVVNLLLIRWFWP
jgi:hypothetical protein